MTEVARIYLGNVNNDSNLAQTIDNQSYWQITLTREDNSKSRIHSYTDSGIAIGIIKSRDRSLVSGDLWKTDTGNLVLINLQTEEVLVLDFSTISPDLAPNKLVHLGHVLGNHHYPISIQNNKIIVQLNTDKLILEKLINNLKITGLQINYQHNSHDQAIAFSKHSH